MSAHFSRGMFQSATYVYSVGFAFTSDVCAPACPDQPADMASAHPAAKPFHTLSFMVFLPPLVRPGSMLSIPGHRSVQSAYGCRKTKCAKSEISEISLGAS